MRTVGFTGTEVGMTFPQNIEVRRLLTAARKRGAVEFVFGLCVGADEEAAVIARSLGYRTVGLPGFDVGHPKRSLFDADEIDPVEPPLTRNSALVTIADEMVAAPRETREVLRSGTWATIRRARASGKPLSIVSPTGASLD